jgi:hypothetical protein
MVKRRRRGGYRSVAEAREAEYANECRRRAVTWAALTLRAAGAELHPVDGGGWDVLFTGGALQGWHPCENWRELCDLAQRTQAA